MRALLLSSLLSAQALPVQQTEHFHQFSLNSHSSRYSVRGCTGSTNF